jgi:ZIP family zinc transporter
MKELMPFILTLIAGFSTMLGCLGIFLPVKKKDDFISFSISLSLSVMLLISLFDLIPSSLSSFGNLTLSNILLFALVFASGILLVTILNKIIKGKGSEAELYKVGILNFIALVLHNLPEGILTFMSTYQDFNLGLSLCIAITLHNIPEGISIAVPIYYSTNSVGEALKCTLLSALAEPIGAVLTYVLLKDYITSRMVSIFLVLVAGIMITLSIEKMFPEVIKYNKKKSMYLGFLIGTIVVLLSLLIL